MCNCQNTIMDSKLIVPPVSDKFWLSYFTEKIGGICMYLNSHAIVKGMQENFK